MPFLFFSFFSLCTFLFFSFSHPPHPLKDGCVIYDQMNRIQFYSIHHTDCSHSPVIFLFSRNGKLFGLPCGFNHLFHVRPPF
ncbi:hypothetical protein BKA57DRAFT_447724 [Linnemannia elongata]|nr:hypothetical protein BKA57DRAFT_447724 [Linnemannia elongata]